MQIINSTLSVRGCSKDGAFVIAQHLQPGADIGGVIVAIFELQFEVRAKKRRAELGNELFFGIAGITKTLATE